MSDAPILAPVNLVADLDAAGDFEKKHTPHIDLDTAGDTLVVTVTVGWDVPHPNQPDHYITWIELLANDAPVARFDLSPVATAPTVSVKTALDAGTVLRAVAHCNLHGLWAAEVTV
ncbi:MAG: desulfoferrodoxin family protein [Coriobacteriales bacterium]|nr:class II SORL domain-containing protein [Actinomycetes bacterium]